MPTGYTADIAKGITFKEYAMGCARAFGALIHMRGESYDTPIPKELPKDDYHSNQLKEAKEELSKFKSLSNKELLAAFRKYKKDTLAYHKRYYNEKKELAKKYKAMLVQVKKYTPPTPEHNHFKKFMIEQVEGSISFDCGDYQQSYKDSIYSLKTLTKADWYSDALKSLERSVEYHERELAEETKRNLGRQEWIDQLRESIEGI